MAVKKVWFETTLCWNCPTVYPLVDRDCPHCHALNRNTDPQKAQFAIDREREDCLVSYIQD